MERGFGKGGFGVSMAGLPMGELKHQYEES